MSFPEPPSFDSVFLVRGLSLFGFCVGVNFLSVLGFFVLRTVGFLVGELELVFFCKLAVVGFNVFPFGIGVVLEFGGLTIPSPFFFCLLKCLES